MTIPPLPPPLRSPSAAPPARLAPRPENIFFDLAGRMTLGDFGLAINLNHDSAVSRVGTLEYMAPEVSGAQGAHHLSTYQLTGPGLPPKDPRWSAGMCSHIDLVLRKHPIGSSQAAAVQRGLGTGIVALTGASGTRGNQGAPERSRAVTTTNMVKGMA